MTKGGKALSYATDLGWAVLPLHTILDGKCSCGRTCKSPGKHPRNMNGAVGATTDEDTIKNWWDMWPNSNIGVATGKKSGFVVIDIDPRNGGDITIDKLQEENSVLPKNVLALTGGGGLHILYKYEGQASTKIKGGVDIKSDGGYIVVDPSNHISGGNYEWEISSDPFENELPLMPEWFKGILKNGNDPTERSLPDGQKIEPEQYQEIRSALASISCEDRDVWKDIGMCLQATESGDQAFGLWAEWSQSSPKYDPADTRRVWNSFTSTKGLTLATLFKTAHNNGWVEPISLTVPVEPPTSFLTSQVVPKKKSSLPSELLEPTGAIKEIYDYMTATCRKVQPIYFLNAAISLVSTVMGQKYEGETGLRTNMYMVSIGPTASGKEHGRKCVKDILHAADMSANLGGEEIKSGQGLLAAMNRSSNTLFQLDEFGQFLQAAQIPGSGGHKVEVLTNMMKLFTSANTVFIGGEYANQVHNPRVELQYPCCNLHATTTGAEFFPSLQSTHVVNGYLNRMLVLESEEKNPPKQRPKKTPVPYAITEWIKKISNGDGYDRPGNLSGVAASSPITIENGAEAWELMDEFEEKIERMDVPEELRALWGRALEHTWKLSVVVAGANLRTSVSAADMTYAIKFVEYSITQLCVSVTERVADSPFQAKVKECLLAVRTAGEKGLTDRELHRHRAFSKLPPRERKDIMEALEKSEQIIKYKIPTGGKPRDAWVVR